MTLECQLHHSRRQRQRATITRHCGRRGSLRAMRGPVAAAHLVAGSGGGGGAHVVSHHARLRQLEGMRERQISNEHRMEAALEEASTQLRRLQLNNARSTQAAEDELLSLSQRLQESFKVQHALRERTRRADEDVSELATRRAELEWQRDQAIEETRVAAGEFRDLDSALADEKSEKERLLFELHERRLAVEKLAGEAVATTATRDALQSEVQRLRRDAEMEARIDVGEAIIEEKRRLQLVRETFARYVNGLRVVRKEARFRERRLASCGRSTFTLWHIHSKILQRLRLFQNSADRANVSRAFIRWSRLTAESLWLERQYPVVAKFSEKWATRKAWASWCMGLQALNIAQRAPCHRRLRACVFRAWHKESAGLWWTRFLEVRLLRRSLRGFLIRYFTALACIVRYRIRCRRGARLLQQRSWPHRARRAIRSWAGYHNLLVQINSFLRRLSFSALQRCWRWWAKQRVWQSHLRASSLQKDRRYLSKSFHSFLNCSLRARALRDLKQRLLHRDGVDIVRRIVFPHWISLTAAGRVLRVNAGMLLHSLFESRFSWWQGWARKSRAMRRRKRKCELACARRRIQTERLFMHRWRAVVRVRRWRQQRSTTIMSRQRHTVFHHAWCGWLRALRIARHERHFRLTTELDEMQFSEAGLQGALHEAQTKRSDAELLRIRLVDELHSAAQEVAHLTVEHQEARQTSETLDHGVLTEHVAAQRYRERATILRSECEHLVAQRANRVTMLEQEVEQAMGAPLELRMALREGENEARAAGLAESEARQTADTLRQELEKLHAFARVDLRQRNDEVAAMQAQVEHVRRYTQDIGHVLQVHQSSLHTHRVKLEERHCEDSVRELEMLYHA